MIPLSRRSFPSLQVFLEVTYRCNLSYDLCEFLRTHNHGAEPAHQRLSELYIMELEDIVVYIPSTAIVSFTGGEPFVKTGFMDLLGFAFARSKTHIFTNGTKMDGQVVHSLISLGASNMWSAGLVLIGISLEGLEATHDHISIITGSFRKTLSAIEALTSFRRGYNKRFPLIELKTVISENNVSQLHELYWVAKDFGADIFYLMVMNQLPHASLVSTPIPVNLTHSR